MVWDHDFAGSNPVIPTYFYWGDAPDPPLPAYKSSGQALGHGLR